MGAILTTLEKLIERRDRRRPDSPAIEPSPYPDASKAVECFKLKLAERVQASRRRTPAWKQE